MSTTFFFKQNSELESRMNNNYNIIQEIGAKQTTISEVISNGLSYDTDRFFCSSLGTHLNLVVEMTLNIDIPFTGTSVAVSGTTSTYLAPQNPIIAANSFTYIEPNAMNNLIQRIRISNGLTYESVDMAYRDPDISLVKSMAWNNVQCDKYDLKRFPTDSLVNLSQMGKILPPLTKAEVDNFYSNRAGFAATLLNPIYGEDTDNWVSKYNNNGHLVKTVSAYQSNGSILYSRTDFSRENDIVLYSDSACTQIYYGLYYGTLQLQYTSFVSDPLFRTRFESELNRSIRINNASIALDFQYRTSYLPFLWKNMQSGGIQYGSPVFSSQYKNSIRIHSFSTTMSDNSPFAQPYLSLDNRQSQICTLLNGTSNFVINLNPTFKIASQYLVKCSSKLWDGLNQPLLTQILASTGINSATMQQSNLSSYCFGQITNLQIYIDNVLVTANLTNNYILRQSAEKMSTIGLLQRGEDGAEYDVFNKEIYDKLSNKSAVKLVWVNGSDIDYTYSTTPNGGVPCYLIDMSRLSLDGRTPLINSNIQKSIRFSGTVSLDPTSSLQNYSASQTMSFEVGVYELNQKMLVLNPQDMIINDMDTTNGLYLGNSQDVETIVRNVLEEQAQKPRVATFNQMVGGAFYRNFLSSLGNLIPVATRGLKDGFQVVLNGVRGAQPIVSSIENSLPSGTAKDVANFVNNGLSGVSNFGKSFGMGKGGRKLKINELY